MGEAKERENEATDGREATKHHPVSTPLAPTPHGPPLLLTQRAGHGSGDAGMVCREKEGARERRGSGRSSPSVRPPLLRGMPGPCCFFDDAFSNEQQQRQRRSVGKNKRCDDVMFSSFFLLCCAQATPSKTAPQHSPRNARTRRA